MFEIHILPQLQDNYSYILRDEINNITSVIDPSVSEVVIDFLKKRNWKLDYILNTHHHHDHTGGNMDLKNKYDAKIIASLHDENHIENIDILLADGDQYRFPSICNVIHIPGHTYAHIAYHFVREKFLFSGDTLFSLGCGRIFEGTAKQMLSSVKKLTSLPKSTKIYSGHEYSLKNAQFILSIDYQFIETFNYIKSLRNKMIPTTGSTLEFELKNNIFLRSDDLYIKNLLSMQGADELEVFSFLRAKKDLF